MSIEATCARCLESIEGKAALLYGDPLRKSDFRVGGADLVPKRHLCVRCYEIIINSFPKARDEEPSLLEIYVEQNRTTNLGFAFSFDNGKGIEKSVGLVAFYDEDGKVTILANFDIPPEVAKKLPGDGIATIPLKR